MTKTRIEHDEANGTRETTLAGTLPIRDALQQHLSRHFANRALPQSARVRVYEDDQLVYGPVTINQALEEIYGRAPGSC